MGSKIQFESSSKEFEEDLETDFRDGGVVATFWEFVADECIFCVLC